MNDKKNNTGDSNTGDSNTGDKNTGNCNTGYYNTGNSNTGDWNTGNRNTGNSNTGDWNTGDCNTGDWNTGNRNTGFFNTDSPDTIRVFGKEIDINKWDKSYKPSFLYFNLTEWILEEDMTIEEKTLYPDSHITGGYLKKYEYKEALQKSWNKADPKDRIQIKDLPNFDADIFYEISGIKVDNPVKRKITIDGKDIELSEESFNELKKQLT